MQEVIYFKLPERQRRDLHKAAARTLSPASHWESRRSRVGAATSRTWRRSCGQGAVLRGFDMAGIDWVDDARDIAGRHGRMVYG